MEEIHQNHPKKTRQRIINKVDRLSLLPEFILIDIISLLRLDAAGRTSVLSHRWRHLWTHITCIRMDSFSLSDWPSYASNLTFHSFATLSARILEQLKSPKITSFHLGFPGPSHHELIQCSSYLGSWVPLICGGKPQEIKVKLGNFEGFVAMPMCCFQCPSLVKLQLSGYFRCIFPGDDYGVFSINLPNLKELDMRFIDIDLQFLGTIIKSCPLLEILNLEFDWNKNGLVLDIFGNNLKFLGVYIYESSCQSKILIDAPNLEAISLQGCFVIYLFACKLSAIKSARIRFWKFPGEADYRSDEISELVGVICNVGFLKIMGSLAILNPIYHLHPDVFEKFINLTELCLNYDSAEEVNRIAPLPICLLRRLKYCELFDINGDVKDLKLVKYILRHSIVLEKLIIYLSHEGGNDNLWSEYKFCDALFEMRARSLSCDVQFHGMFITASSSGYRNGSHSCEISYDVLDADEVEEVSDFSENSE